MKNLKPGKHLYAVYFMYEYKKEEEDFINYGKRIIFIRRVKDFDKTKVLEYYIEKIY